MRDVPVTNSISRQHFYFSQVLSRAQILFSLISERGTAEIYDSLKYGIFS
jgi:hypothetical protein